MPHGERQPRRISDYRQHSLLDALHPGSFEDENEEFTSKEASDIYDEIFFFTDERTLALPDKELVEELRRDNLEWF